MFEAADLNRRLDATEKLKKVGDEPAPNAANSNSRPRTSQPSEAVLTVLQAGFRARVMSWQSAHDLGARNCLSLQAMRERTDQCASLIFAGLPCAVDETLFAALVFHYPAISKELSRALR